MGSSGSGGYAKGYWALGMCERCSKKMLRRLMVYDGQFPDLLVCSECWDPRHPSEYLPSVTDPVVIYDPTGDPDRVQADTLVITWPLFDGTTMPLSIGLALNTDEYQLVELADFAFDPAAFAVSAFETDAFSLG